MKSLQDLVHRMCQREMLKLEEKLIRKCLGHFWRAGGEKQKGENHFHFVSVQDPVTIRAGQTFLNIFFPTEKWGFVWGGGRKL